MSTETEAEDVPREEESSPLEPVPDSLSEREELFVTDTELPTQDSDALELSNQEEEESVSTKLSTSQEPTAEDTLLLREERDVSENLFSSEEDSTNSDALPEENPSEEEEENTESDV